MPDSKLTFDADTAAYDAKMDTSIKRTEGMATAFEGAAAPLMRIIGTIGIVSAAAEGAAEKFRVWREQIEKAAAANKILQEDLASAVGMAGRLEDYSAISATVQESRGPLSLKGKESAVAGFLGSNPDASLGSIGTFLGQAQKATEVVGAGNVDKWSAAVSQGIQSGLSQKQAGNVALAAVQAGPGGTEALSRLFGKYAEENPTLEERKKGDFLGFVNQSQPSDLGIKPGQVLSFKLLQDRLANGASLDDQAKTARESEVVGGEIAKATRESNTERSQHQNYGDRAELEEEFQTLVKQQRSRGKSPWGGTWYRSDENLRTAIKFMKADEQTAGAPSSPGGMSSDATAHLAEIAKNTSQPAGALKFANENQDRDKEPE